ncbi:MAG: hypothetical protein J6Y26_02985, partial [Lachnospiraceae bacterium]|nr:hypothetical protein [Lachnospiraceae bacterium]
GNTNGNLQNGGRAVSDGTYIYYNDQTVPHLRLCRYTLATGETYTMWDQEKYYLGRPGDWLAVRADDPSDVYVIEKGIFEKTYEKWN